MRKQKIILLGKLPPPYFGPAIATKIILASELQDYYKIIHVDTGINNSIYSIGKFKLNKVFILTRIYAIFFIKIIKHWPVLIIIPNSQSTGGFLKDSIFILISKMFIRKVLVYTRGSDIRNWYNKVNRITKSYFLLCMKLINGVIVQGNKLRYLYQGFIQNNKIYVVPNGANFNFNSVEQSKIFNILYFSNCLESKGVTDVIEAIFLLSDLQHEYYCTIVGEWYDKELEAKCRSFINDHNLPIFIQPPQTGSEKEETFKQASLFVFPPREPEGHPWVIVESLAAGLPIIATDQGAITESVFHGVNGYIVKPSNPFEIAERIKNLIDNPQQVQIMSRSSRQIYLKNFTEAIMVYKLKNVIKTVINEIN